MPSPSFNIAIVTPFVSYHGGVESVNANLLRIFDKHQVTFITLDDIPNKRGIFSRILRKFGGGDPALLSRYFRSLKGDFDIVLCNGEFGYGIKHGHAINLFHGSAWGYLQCMKKFTSKSQQTYWKQIYRLQKQSAKGKYVVAVSDYLRFWLESQGIAVDETIPNGIDTKHFTLPSPIKKRNGRYLFVGSYDHYGKGFDILLELAKKGLPIDCVSNRPLPSPLNRLKPRDNRSMKELYQEYEVLIFPSRFEGMGMVPLEAMACGMPVVLTPVGFFSEFEKVFPEFVTRDTTSDAIIKKLEKILANRESLAKKAFAYVDRHCSMEVFSKKWNLLLEKVVK